MKIVVPVKSVVDVELNLRVRDGRLQEDGLNYVLSKWDEHALEAALQLCETNDGEVIVVTVGLKRAGEALRKALAMGAHKGIHVLEDGLVGSDSKSLGRVLAAAIKRESADLVVTGRQAQDTDMGATGWYLAAALGLPAVSNVAGITLELCAGRLELERKGDAGMEMVSLALPALITANDSLNEPRLASLRGIMQAKKKPVEVVSLEDLGLSMGEVGPDANGCELLGLLAPPDRVAGQKFSGDVSDITTQAMEKLDTEAKLFSS